MPFITEEIWQQLPKPAGTPGSIMITMYPVADQSLVDEAAERQMRILQDVVVAIRNLRAEYNVPPSVRLEVTVQTGSDEVREVLSVEEALVRSLARTGVLTLSSAGDAPAGTVVSVVGDAQVCVHLKGTVDVAAERARIEKDIAKAEKELAGVKGRLGNESFVARAPAEIVEKERARQAELEERIAKLKKSLERLGSL
jgi:valyl-tRNA synthetase